MWTDGAHNAVTNFALNSELEGDKCCVKAGGRGWRGEKCGELVIVVDEWVRAVTTIPTPMHIRQGMALNHM